MSRRDLSGCGELGLWMFGRGNATGNGYGPAKTTVKPQILTTVFAGQDWKPRRRAREYFVGYPPSSPSVAILRDGELVYMMERHQIEGHTPQEIADALKAAFDEHCG